MKYEQKSVAVGPGNAHFISIRQVSSDAVTLRHGTCGHAAFVAVAAAAAAAGGAAVYRQFGN